MPPRIQIRPSLLELDRTTGPELPRLSLAPRVPRRPESAEGVRADVLILLAALALLIVLAVSVLLIADHWAFGPVVAPSGAGTSGHGPCGPQKADAPERDEVRGRPASRSAAFAC